MDLFRIACYAKGHRRSQYAIEIETKTRVGVHTPHVLITLMIEHTDAGKDKKVPKNFITVVALT